MRPTDYVEMMMEDFLDIEKEITMESLLSIDYEMDYIYRCMESNSVLTEKVTPKQENIFVRLGKAISEIFSKFIEKSKRIISDLTPMKKEYLDKLNQISYENIPIKAFPYWDVEPSKTAADLGKMINAAHTTIRRYEKESAPEWSKTPEGIIQNLSPFTAYKHDTEGYQSVMKMKFSTGDNLSNYKSVEITDPNAVKNICAKASTFIQSYKAYVADAETTKNKYLKLVKDIEKAQKRRAESTKESFNPYLLLEDAYLSETDLKYCSDFGLLLEADEPNKNDKSEETPGNPQVGDTTNNSGNKDNDQNTNGETTNINKTNATLAKNLFTIIYKSIIVHISVLEAKYYFYKSLIRQVVTQAEKNKTKGTDPENKDKPVDNPDNPTVGDKATDNNDKQDKEKPKKKKDKKK